MISKIFTPCFDDDLYIFTEETKNNAQGGECLMENNNRNRNNRNNENRENENREKERRDNENRNNENRNNENRKNK